ncbi:MAG: O-antigen ligase family protein [Solibacillus sp.]
MTSFYEELNKRDVISDEAENRQSRQKADKWIFGILLSIIGFMPLIIMGDIEEIISPLVTTNGLLTSGVKGELFTSYKALYLVVATIIAAAILLAKIFFMNGTIRKSIFNYALGIFAVMIVLSTIFSPNISIAMSGQYNRSDGAMSWLCYTALMFIAMNIEYPKKVVTYVTYAFYPFVLINFVIITMNFYGHDLLQRGWMQTLTSLFLPEGASLGSGSEIVGTLNQWNYMSGMFAVMAILFLAWAIVDEHLVRSIISMVMAVISAAVMLMALSTSGFLALVVTMIFILFLVVKVTNKKRAIGILLGFIILSAGAMHTLANENHHIWDESFGFFVDSNPYKEVAATVSIGDIFESKAYASDEVLELPVLPEAAWAPGTGRFYIWEKTLDLVKERPLVGYGLDSIMYNFPHYNIDARGGNYDEKTIVDKPHNTYMGILYGTGIFGILALLFIIAGVSLMAIKQIVTKNALKLGVFMTAIIAFAVQALFNDSLPGMTSVLFVLMGILVVMLKDTQQVNE